MANANVFQLGRGSVINSTNNLGSSNSVLMEYEFQDIFPTNVSQIDLSYDSSDTLEEFTVEFQVQSFRVLESKWSKRLITIKTNLVINYGKIIWVLNRGH